MWQGSLTGNPGSSLELVAADITQRATLLPEMFADVRALVVATAVKVAPKEGDTPDRAKYRQVHTAPRVQPGSRARVPARTATPDLFSSFSEPLVCF